MAAPLQAYDLASGNSAVAAEVLALCHQKAGSIVPFCLAMQAPPGGDLQYCQLAIGQWDLRVRNVPGFCTGSSHVTDFLSQTALLSKNTM